MTDTEFNDPERLRLVESIQGELLKKALVALPRVSWAFLWLADIEKLQTLQRKLAANEGDDIRGFLMDSNELMNHVLKPWMKQKPTRTPGTPQAASPSERAAKRRRVSGSVEIPQNTRFSPLNPQSPPVQATPLPPIITNPCTPTRDATLAGHALHRDTCCILTKVIHPSVLQGAHIFPYSMTENAHNSQSRLWEYLKVVWKDETIEGWYAAVAAPLGSETISNMLTLDCSVHRAWDLHLFALKHLKTSDGRTEMELQFFWLKEYSTSGHDFMSVKSLTHQPELPQQLPHEVLSRYPVYFRTDVNRPISSEDVVTLLTFDPELYPLPDERLIDIVKITAVLALVLYILFLI